MRKGVNMSKETKKHDSEVITPVRSVSMSSGYDLAQALTGDNYNPSLVDDWYKHQRKVSLKYAKELVAG